MTDTPKTMVDVFSDTKLDTTLATNPAGVAIAAMADDDPSVITLTADLANTLVEFRERHPDRYLEFGIAETNSISVAAGLAACGLRPYLFAMSPFGMLKCAEQIRTDLAYNHLPVRIVGRLTGLAMGLFGTSHHAVEDIAVARAITGMTVVAPADAHSTVALMRATADLEGPVYLRIAEDAAPVYDSPPDYAFGRWLRVREGDDVSLIGHGMGVGLAVRAAARLAASGIEAEVWDAAYLRPHDTDAVLTAARTGRIVTVEDHNIVGGLASIVAETLGRAGVHARLGHVALPDEDLEVGVPADLYAYYHLDVDGVVARVAEITGRL